MATLVFSVQDRKLFEFKISSHRVVLGRSDTCDVALPGEGLSRQHCRLDKRGKRWMLSDLSKHGTYVGDVRVTKTLLKVGDAFVVGPYTVLVQGEVEEPAETVSILTPKHHEFIVACDNNILVERAVLKVLQGPNKGKKVVLKQIETSVGGRGSGVYIEDKTLKKEHFSIAVSRGRPMVTPVNGPVFLDGHRLLGTTPIYDDDVFSVGQSRFAIHVSEEEDVQPQAERFGSMIGTSKIMQHVFGRLKVFACHDFPVLITGESGTGKELAAKGLHIYSHRASGPFVALNCGGMTESLIESQLFGYEKGAFTGANTRKDGAFQQADKGTLFLDELGELPLSAQVKLLRVLESGEVRRIGGARVEFPDVRIVAATNRDLHTMVSKGTFREDLLFRLQVLSVQLPALRDRKEDIFQISQFICEQFGPSCILHDSVKNMLWNYEWPGNIRELRNVLSRAFVLGEGHISPEYIEVFSTPIPETISDEMKNNRMFLQRTLHNCEGNLSQTARQLGVPRTTLAYKLRKFGLM
jgi:transcriptional regulator with PAS, ATPase and Fis domain